MRIQKTPTKLCQSVSWLFPPLIFHPPPPPVRCQVALSTAKFSPHVGLAGDFLGVFRRFSEVWRLHNTYLGFRRTGINFTLYFPGPIFITPLIPPLDSADLCASIFNYIHTYPRMHKQCNNKVDRLKQSAKSQIGRRKEKGSLADKS